MTPASRYISVLSLAPSLSQVEASKQASIAPSRRPYLAPSTTQAAMATSPHFPRSPSPYPPPLTRTPSSSTKRSSSEQSRATSDENTIVEDTTFDRIATAEEGKMASRPGAPDRKNSLASLSVAHDRNDAYDDEPTWPKNPKAYLCALGGFFLMFNSWGLVSRQRSGHVVTEPRLTERQVNAYGTYSSYYGQHLMPEKKL